MGNITRKALKICQDFDEIEKQNPRFKSLSSSNYRLKDIVLSKENGYEFKGEYSFEDESVVYKVKNLARQNENVWAIMSEDGYKWKVYAFSDLIKSSSSYKKEQNKSESINTLPEDVRITNEELKSKLGINIESYRTSQLIHSMSSLITFPIRCLRKIFSFPIYFLIGILLLCIILILINKGALSIVLFFILGSLLAITNGLVLGVYNILKSIFNDISKVIFFSLDQTRLILSDIKNQFNNLTELPKPSALTKAFIYLIVLPTLIQITQKHFRLFSNVIIRFIYRSFDFVIPKIEKLMTDYESTDISKKILLKVNSIGSREVSVSIADRSIIIIDKSCESLKATVSHYRSVILRPFRFSLMISLTLSIIILLLILFL